MGEGAWSVGDGRKSLAVAVNHSDMSKLIDFFNVIIGPDMFKQLSKFPEAQN